ncbi:MAG TPA: hypothetical protein ENG01_00725, partial [Candidatus Aenigmarchaeota archaeon]|nr:hypothetical protein [Candidatus Aenigmarchaeota archaeon]HEX32920.1 hypothetical protein [Candidatus Aenigmarchaeota archaeon]
MLSEEQVLEFWDKKKVYKKVKNSLKNKKQFTFLDGPPYANGKIHLGHAWNRTFKDIVLRYKRMNGFNVNDR